MCRGDPEKTADLNADHALDLAELGGDEATAADVLYEVKCPSPTTQSWAAGHGSAEGGGKPASVGHLFGFGNTEEKYRVMTLGCKGCGRARDGPFNHWTGKGWVKAQKGHYADGIRKGAIVNPMIVEAGYGGIAPHSFAVCVRLAQRAGGAHAVDRTKYGSTRISTKSYLVHHVQQISKAAVIGDARAILKQITHGKQRMCATTAQADATGGLGA